VEVFYLLYYYVMYWCIIIGIFIINSAINNFLLCMYKIMFLFLKNIFSIYQL